MKVKIGVSNRHVHLSESDFKKLFNSDKTLEVVKELTQPGEFASNLKVTLKTGKSVIENVRVLGPLRSYTQVEISKTDAYKLGLNPPVRESGDVLNSEDITIIGDNEVTIPSCCILASRHIHATNEDIKKYNLDPTKKYSVRVLGEKGGIFDNVSVKVSDKYYFEMHIDTDDANAHLLENGSEGFIINE
ncbi:MAG: phosphate propanoyltransferase [Firmicutes bacterium]|nr:phosphate propanoyltransferase [Bacillota bacterium]